MATLTSLSSLMQRKLRKVGHPELAKRVSRAVAGGNNPEEQIDRLSLTLLKIRDQDTKSYRAIQDEARDFFQYYNNLWA